MQKFYSIVLMAVALLVGTNVQAEKVATMTLNGTTSDVEDLYAAFTTILNTDNAVATITLTKAATLNGSPTRLKFYHGQDITLDLAGNNLVDGLRIDIANAKLRVINSSETQAVIDATNCNVEGGATYLGWQPFNAYGVSQTDANVARDACYLLLGANISLQVVSYGIGAMPYGMFSSKLAKTDPYYAKAATGQPTYGETVDVYGEILASDGNAIATSGNMNFSKGDKTKCPIINIYSSARIIGSADMRTIQGANTSGEPKAVYDYYVKKGESGDQIYKSSEAAVYGPGYAEWNITGYLAGGVGLYIKGGKYNIDGAEIHATAAEYWAPIAYSNGFIGAGSAIIFDSNVSYAGQIEMNITGETEVTSESGYAIQDVTTTGTTTAVNDITIESGSFESNSPTGDVITTTPELQEQIVNNGSITGGTYNGDITDFLSNVTGIITPIEDEHGNTVYVVAEQPAGTVWIHDITAADENSYVSLNGGGTVTLAADAQAKYLSMEGVDKIIIPAGFTLTVGEIVMGPDAVIDIQAGAALIVNDPNGGIVSNKVENFVLRASATSAALLLIDPAMKANKHPMASVELYSPAYKEVNGTVSIYHTLHVGIPYLAPEKNATFPNSTTYMYKWVGGTNPWQNISSSLNLDEAFRGYLLLNDATTAAGINTFYGRLVGVGDAALKLDINSFNLMGNSYNAPIDAEVLVNTLTAAGADQAEASVWIYKSAEDRYLAINAGSFGGYGTPDFSTIAPMQGFILNRAAAATTTITLNYKDAVWDNPNKNVGPLMAPTRKTSNANVFASIVISADNVADQVELRENNSFSDAFDNGYDASKYMNKAFNVYSTLNNRDLSIVATDNLEGKTLTVQAAEEMVYTMSFKNVNNFDYAILDTKTNAMIDVVEGNVYTFNVMPGEVENNRFKIVGVRNAPTSVETIEATKAIKGVYTVLGQYICETSELNQLPAGIYVVDGQKIVK